MRGTQNGARGVGPAIDTQGFGEGERSVPKRARSSRFETKRATFFLRSACFHEGGSQKRRNGGVRIADLGAWNVLY